MYVDCACRFYVASVCTVQDVIRGFNSGTGSSFIYHPAGRGEHAHRCSEMNVCESAFLFVQMQCGKKMCC